MRDERDMFKKMRDQHLAKYAEILGVNEKLEREVATKRRILAEFEEMKKIEMSRLKATIVILRQELAVS